MFQVVYKCKNCGEKHDTGKQEKCDICGKEICPCCWEYNKKHKQFVCKDCDNQSKD